MPLVASKASVREVFPWSTWARIHICYTVSVYHNEMASEYHTLRMSWDCFCRLASFSGVTTGIVTDSYLVCTPRPIQSTQCGNPIAFLNTASGVFPTIFAVLKHVAVLLVDDFVV